jgi:hypothetical protein
MGFSFSAWGFFATFFDMWAKIYQLNIINQYLIFICTPRFLSQPHSLPFSLLDPFSSF